MSDKVTSELGGFSKGKSMSEISRWAGKANEKRGSQQEQETVSSLVESGNQVLSVHWSEIYSKAQVRKVFKNIETLAESLDQHGQDHPIRVFPKDSEGYLIRKGERRWRACKLNDGTVDIIVDDRNANDEVKELIGQIVENFQREDLTPMELANGFGELRDKGLKQKEIAKAVGISETKLSKYLSLLKTPEVVTDLLDTEVTSDLDLIATLRKIHELDEDRCEQMCAAALDNGITRDYANSMLRGIQQERSDVDRSDANPKSSNPKLDDPGAVADQEHDAELNEAGLNESGLEYPPEPDPEPEETSAKAPSGSEPKQKESALLTEDGFYERKAEDAILLCEVPHKGTTRTGSIQLHLMAGEDHQIVVRLSDESGKDEMIAVGAALVKLIGYRQ